MTLAGSFWMKSSSIIRVMTSSMPRDFNTPSFHTSCIACHRIQVTCINPRKRWSCMFDITSGSNWHSSPLELSPLMLKISFGIWMFHCTRESIIGCNVVTFEKTRIIITRWIWNRWWRRCRRRRWWWWLWMRPASIVAISVSVIVIVVCVLFSFSIAAEITKNQ